MPQIIPVSEQQISEQDKRRIADTIFAQLNLIRGTMMYVGAHNESYGVAKVDDREMVFVTFKASGKNYKKGLYIYIFYDSNSDEYIVEGIVTINFNSKIVGRYKGVQASELGAHIRQITDGEIVAPIQIGEKGKGTSNATAKKMLKLLDFFEANAGETIAGKFLDLQRKPLKYWMKILSPDFSEKSQLEKQKQIDSVATAIRLDEINQAISTRLIMPNDARKIIEAASLPVPDSILQLCAIENKFIAKKMKKHLELLHDEKMENGGKIITYYNSHGHKALWSEIRETEIERGNYTDADFDEWEKKYGIKPTDKAIWVTPSKRSAYAYMDEASAYDKIHAMSEEKLEKYAKRKLGDPYEYSSDAGVAIPESDDGDNGFLFVISVIDTDIPKYLYHATPSYKAQSIKEKGLVLGFDNRIYLAKTFGAASDIAQQLHEEYKKEDNEHNIKFYHILRIDTDKLPSAIFYKDNDYDAGVYVQQPIPKNAIKHYESTRVSLANGGAVSGMKQIDEVLGRALRGERPLAHKYRAFIKEDKLGLFHYHHLLLVYDLATKKPDYTWHETPTDKRGLNAAIAYLDSYAEKFDMGGLFHGSQHSFNKFKLSDSVEDINGADYGYGVYFTDDEGVAKAYARKWILGNLDDLLIKQKADKNDRMWLSAIVFGNDGDIDRAKKYLKELKGKPDDFKKRISGYLDIISDKSKNKLFIYKVTVHKNYSENEYDYLIWEEPVTKKQKYKIENQLSKEPKNKKLFDGRLAQNIKNYDRYNNKTAFETGENLYSLLSYSFGTQKLASEFLLRCKIDGIKYKQPNNADRYNYVVFSPQEITIDKVQKFDSGGSVLLAPNGKPSNLNEVQYRLVRTPAFKKWFGDWENSPATASKVVDENGEPLVVYHGTKSEWWENNYFVFNPQYEGQASSFGDKRRKFGGIYFTSNKFAAETFGKIVVPVFLNFKKTITIQGNGKWIDDVYNCGDNNDGCEYEDDVIIKNVLDVFPNGDSVSDFVNRKDIKKFYSDVYITTKIFGAIKLADGSNTTFDSANPDIRYDAGGSVDGQLKSVQLKRTNKYPVGKEIGGSIYVHKKYENQFPNDQLLRAKSLLPKGFHYDIVKYTPETKSFSFIVSSDFNINPEPSVEGGYTVVPNHPIREIKNSGWIYHHKWMWVADDYDGFDVNESKKRSIKWTSLPDVDKSRIGQRAFWDKNVIPRLRFEVGGSILLAPNGKPSNLNEVQYKLVRTPAFKKWFGDWENSPETASKVVDENGEPLVVYHGTKNRFDVFDMDKIGTKTDTGMWGDGFYFGSSKKYAQTYANKSYDYKTQNILSHSGYVFDVFLSLKNPYIIKNQNDIPRIITPNETMQDLKNSDKAYSEKFRQTLVDKGYDGVFVKFEFQFRGSYDYELVAFHPNQIKLADGTNTTFDSNNPDIRYDAGGAIMYHGSGGEVSDTIVAEEKFIEIFQRDNYTERYYDKGTFSLKLVRGNDGKFWAIDLYEKNYAGGIGIIVGTIEVSYGTDIKEVMKITNGQPIVSNISIDEHHRNKGIATLLYKELIEILKKDGWEKLYSDTTRNSRFVDNLWNRIKTGDISVEYEGRVKKIDYVDLNISGKSSNLIPDIRFALYSAPFGGKIHIKHLDYPSGSTIDFYSGKIYLVGDDAKYISILDTDFNEVGQIELFHHKEARIPKPEKVDIEASAILNVASKPHLFLVGSASKKNRERVFLVPLDGTKIQSFDYSEFADRLLYDFGLQEINIEGCAITKTSILLSSRGNKTNPSSYIIKTDKDFWVNQKRANISICEVELPKGAGVSGMTYDNESDTLLFTASTENTENAYDDAEIGDSYIGIVLNVSDKLNGKLIPDSILNLAKFDKTFSVQKIEGICIERKYASGYVVNLVADNDDGQTTMFKLTIGVIGERRLMI